MCLVYCCLLVQISIWLYLGSDDYQTAAQISKEIYPNLLMNYLILYAILPSSTTRRASYKGNDPILRKQNENSHFLSDILDSPTNSAKLMQASSDPVLPIKLHPNKTLSPRAYQQSTRQTPR